jgi:hypothetical protein
MRVAAATSNTVASSAPWGDGVRVGASKIPGAGLGLFVTQTAFATGDIITGYDGA